MLYTRSDENRRLCSYVDVADACDGRTDRRYDRNSGVRESALKSLLKVKKVNIKVSIAFYGNP